MSSQPTLLMSDLGGMVGCRSIEDGLAPWKDFENTTRAF